MNALTGNLFDIERFSHKDGPGIRTVVFFKGCNLHCKWCHNPEGLTIKAQLLYEADRCICCGACAAACPSGAHIFEMPDRVHTLNRETCKSCFRCVDACPSDALRKIGRAWTVDELMPLLIEDNVYYRNSGGGVTLSGGEAALQGKFAVSLLKKLKEMNIHTAIETNLCVPWEAYEEMLPALDLVMADIKTTDPDVQKEWIGGSAQLIQENLMKILNSDVKIIIRTPVIPTINDTPAEIEAIARLLSGHKNLLYYELLPYHPLGNMKAEWVNETIHNFEIPTNDALQILGRRAQEAGIPVMIGGKTLTSR